jgi:hypothetical protein
MSNSSDNKTNPTCYNVRLSNRMLGGGACQVCVKGTYIDGKRNQQEAACKRFKPELRFIEDLILQAILR